MFIKKRETLEAKDNWQIKKEQVEMINLNILKMVGLVVLLTIALALPVVLPKTGEVQDGRAQMQESGVLRGGVV